MHSPTKQSQTGRYQSRLLNFLNKQSLRLKDQTGVVFRHLKLATVTGAQIVLYPIYALFQATRIADRQLRQTAERVLAYLMPGQPEPESDLVIQQIFGQVQHFLPVKQQIEPQVEQQASLSEVEQIGLSIQAIASDLQTRQLYLLNHQGQPIQLTEPQQHQIQQKIIFELAHYWQLWRKYQRRQAILRFNPASSADSATGTVQLIKRPAALPIVDRPNLIPPVRFFYQLMAWVQQGSLANRLNLFEETAIVPQPSNDWFAPRLHQLPSDAQILKSAVAIDWENLNWQELWQSLPNSDGLPKLIRSAVAYFFGQRQNALNQSRPTPTPLEAEIENPWDSPITIDTVAESWVDPNVESIVAEFVETVPQTTIPLTAAPTAVSLPVSPAMPALPSQGQRNVGQKLAIHKLGGLVKQAMGRLRRQAQVPSPQIPSLSQQSHPAIAAAGSSSDASLTWETVFSSDPTTTWIETPAESMGYIKHPLERLLGWLDRGLIWFENQIVGLWQILQQTLRGWLQKIVKH